MSQAAVSTIAIRLDDSLRNKFEKKASEWGFETVAGFFRFLATNVVEGNISVSINQQAEKLSPTKKKHYDKQVAVGGTKYASIDEYIAYLKKEFNEDRDPS